MTTFTLATDSEKQVWSTEYLRDYVRKSGFLPYISASKSNVIKIKNELKSAAGTTVHIPLFMKLSGSGVSGNTALLGNEENLSNYSARLHLKVRRNAVMVNQSERIKTEIDLLNVAREQLLDWSAMMLENDIITEMQSVVVAGSEFDTTVPYATATVAQKNTFLVNNSDRITAVGGLASTTVFADAVAGITSAKKLDAATVLAAKRKAKKTSTVPGKIGITPYRSETDGREWFVLFVDSNGMRDLYLDPTIMQANLYAREKEVDKNPIFQSGDLVYNGVIIREIPAMPAIVSGVGMATLCGVDALAVAYGDLPKSTKEERDYQFSFGVGIQEAIDVQKLSFNGVQTVVSVLHASEDDAA